MPQALRRAPLAAGDHAPPAAAFEAEPESGIVLRLDELIADVNGEIVLFNDSHVRSITLIAAEAVQVEGQSGRYRTAAGSDVTGFQYLGFRDGPKLFYEPALTLVVTVSRK